jgi:TolB-like protein/Tfp pilus assembly protein PilF
MSFFRELKRRNVFRVGIAYGVAAWVLLQVFDVIGEILELPAWGGKMILAMLVIGFFVALVLAWAYELTPEGVKRESEVDRDRPLAAHSGRRLNGLIMALLILAVSYLLFDKFWLQPRLSMGPAATDSAAVNTVPADEAMPGDGNAPGPVQTDPHSIAVLPFENRSPVAADEFFIEGIHDDLLTTLARIGSLKVISRTSVTRYAQTEKSMPEIGRELGVAAIMEGSVQRAGDTVRINVQLIDAATDQHLWAQIYDRPLTTDNLFAIQSEISEQIARALHAELTADEEMSINKRPTENLAAYSAYLRGLRGLAQREVGTLREALAEFQRAVELDPEFALAWAGLANTANVLPAWGGLAADEARVITEQAAHRAMELAPNLGEANLALAGTLEGEAALEQYRKSLELLPNSPSAHLWYANHLQGRPKDWAKALELLERAAELDPLAPIYRHQVARQLMMMGQFEEARRILEQIIETDPQFFPAVSFMDLVLSAQGKYAEAMYWSEKSGQLDPESPFPVGSQVWNLMTLQDGDRLRRLHEHLIESGDDKSKKLIPMVESAIAVLEGRTEAAIEVLKGQPSIPFMFDALESVGWFYLQQRDYAAALEAWTKAHPWLLDQEQWADRIGMEPQIACATGFILTQTGETETGAWMVDTALTYLEQELPRYKQHPLMGTNVHHCHAIRGDYDKALQTVETLFDHGHFDFWWELPSLPYFAPLRGDPRFEKLLQRVDKEMARQRAELDHLEKASPRT